MAPSSTGSALDFPPPYGGNRKHSLLTNGPQNQNGNIFNGPTFVAHGFPPLGASGNSMLLQVPPLNAPHKRHRRRYSESSGNDISAIRGLANQGVRKIDIHLSFDENNGGNKHKMPHDHHRGRFLHEVEQQRGLSAFGTQALQQEVLRRKEEKRLGEWHKKWMNIEDGKGRDNGVRVVRFHGEIEFERKGGTRDGAPAWAGEDDWRH